MVGWLVVYYNSVTREPKHRVYSRTQFVSQSVSVSSVEWSSSGEQKRVFVISSGYFEPTIPPVIISFVSVVRETTSDFVGDEMIDLIKSAEFC